MIHFVTALRAEADPLIDALGLVADEGVTGFRVFRGDEACLTVSGIGRVAAAAATAHLRGIAADVEAVWLNVGVAAHRDLPIGAAVVAHKIVEAASGRSWYPQLVEEPGLPTATVETVDRAVGRPAEERAYDMEASGFYATALRWATAECAGCLKVISDHGIEAGTKLSHRLVRRLVADRLDEIVAFGGALRRLRALGPTSGPTEELTPILERWRFTATQRHQLRRLAVRARSLGFELERLQTSRLASSRELLRSLERHLDRIALQAPIGEPWGRSSTHDEAGGGGP